jgi:hypothetical protein
MQLNKIKLALGFVTAAALAMPMVASAAADQEKAMSDSSNCFIFLFFLTVITNVKWQTTQRKERSIWVLLL